MKFFYILLLLPFSIMAKTELKLDLRKETNSLDVLFYNDSELAITLDYIMCVEPHKGISFLIEDMSGRVIKQSTTLNSGCNLANTINIERYGILGKMIDRELIEHIYSLPHEKLHVTALMCENAFSMTDCISSNRILVDFSL